jgi:hypothetical protein
MFHCIESLPFPDSTISECGHEWRYTDEYKAPRETKIKPDTIRAYKTGKFPRVILGLVCC